MSPSFLLPSSTLEPNPWDCTSNDTIVLYELVMSGVVSDGNQVRCASGDLVMNLECEYCIGIQFISSAFVQNNIMQ